MTRRVGSADLGGDIARQLEQVEVQEKEAGEAEAADHPQLLLQPLGRLRPLGRPRVAQVETPPADLGQGAVGIGVLGARVSVAELAGQVEAQALGEAGGLGDRLGALGKACRHRRRCDQHRAGVAAPAGLGLLERGVGAHGDQRVLELGSAPIVGVDVAGRHRRHPEALGERDQTPVACSVVAPHRPLQLDSEALAPEAGEQPAGQPLGPARVATLDRAGEGTVTGAAGEADEALVALEQGGERERGGEGVAIRARPGVRVGLGQQAAEVVPAGGVLDQNGEMKYTPRDARLRLRSRGVAPC